jgi:hypothetical protein
MAEPPSPEYFTGTFERVGRTADVPAHLMNDVVRLDPLPDGTGVMLTRCLTTGPEPGLALRYDLFGEVPNLLTGKEGPFEVWCQYFNDYGNYPVLICGSDAGARFTLIAQPDAPACAAP